VYSYFSFFAYSSETNWRCLGEEPRLNYPLYPALHIAFASARHEHVPTYLKALNKFVKYKSFLKLGQSYHGEKSMILMLSEPPYTCPSSQAGETRTSVWWESLSLLAFVSGAGYSIVNAWFLSFIFPSIIIHIYLFIFRVLQDY